MSISKSYNKKTGITYVYEVYENHWDPEKQRPVTKRRCIGKIDPKTGEIIPTRKRKSKPEPEKESPWQKAYEASRGLSLDALKKQEQFLETTIDALQQQLKDLREMMELFESEDEQLKDALQLKHDTLNTKDVT